jgi:histidinol-phosphate aminotransferase
MAPIAPQPGILDIAPYQGGAGQLPDGRPALKLSSNENPLGPSPAARAAFAAAADGLERYPSTDHAALRRAIGDVHGLDPGRIVCGVGSDEIIALLCQAYAGPGDAVLHTEHGFAMYRIYAQAAGATPVKVPERDRLVDVDAVLDAAGPRTRLVFIANPGNPTGTMLGPDDLHRLADRLPDSCLLVLDGAYAEFADAYDGGAALVTPRERVIMTRTFSKIHGLGGLRVGWAYAHRAVIDVLNRVRGPFNLSAPALAAAESAIRDQAWVAHCRAENARWRTWLTGKLTDAGIAVDPSHGNFVLARFADRETAEACNRALRADAILVRPVAGYGFPEGLRITIGTGDDCQRVARTVDRFLQHRKSA